MSALVKFRKKFGAFSLSVDFEAENEVLALLGGSGCGKSMTLKCIAGIVTPDEGKIVVDGVTFFDSERGVNLKPQQRRCGLLFQNYALFPNMTAKQNIMTVLRRGSGRCENSEARYREIAEKFFITGLEEHYPSQLSGGQQQRVALARIMASDPAIIMLDEPLSALDSYLRWQLELNLQRTLAEFPGTTLYVSHNRDEVYRLCSKVCVINNGRSEPVKSVAEFFDAPPTLTAAILSGCKNFSRAEAIAPRRIKTLDWGVELDCARDVPGGAKFAGIRAHYIKLSKEYAGAENSFRAEVAGVRIRRSGKQLPRRSRRRARRRFHGHRQRPPRRRAREQRLLDDKNRALQRRGEKIRPRRQSLRRGKPARRDDAEGVNRSRKVRRPSLPATPRDIPTSASSPALPSKARRSGGGTFPAYAACRA